MTIFPPLWSSEVEARVRSEGRNLDEQERPTEVRFCTRCVVSNQRPRIVFDAEGVCSACRYAERKHGWPPGYTNEPTADEATSIPIDWDARAGELDALLDRHRKDRPYDVIVPCSGGKDSASVAHRLKHEHGMHPLCALWEPFLYTDVGRRNIEAFRHAGFDVLSMGPNGLVHRRLARLAFEFYGDPFMPFVYGQLAWPMLAAAHFSVPLVFFGENGEAEYGGDPAANDKPCWDTADWERVYAKGAGVAKLVMRGLELDAFTVDEANDLSPFYRLPLGPARASFAPIEFHWFAYYHRWHPQENYYTACEHTGFEPNDERSEGTYSRYASIDDKLDGLHFYLAFIKFGIGRATSDAAHEVRDGDRTRDEAIALVKRYDGEFPSRHLDECLDYLGMDIQHFQCVVDRFRSHHVWKYVEGPFGPEPRLKHTVY